MNFGTDVLGKTVQFPKVQLNKSSVFTSSSFFLFSIVYASRYKQFSCVILPRNDGHRKTKDFGVEEWRNFRKRGDWIRQPDAASCRFPTLAVLTLRYREKSQQQIAVRCVRIGSVGSEAAMRSCALAYSFTNTYRGALSKCCQTGPWSFASGLKGFLFFFDGWVEGVWKGVCSFIIMKIGILCMLVYVVVVLFFFLQSRQQCKNLIHPQSKTDPRSSSLTQLNKVVV